MEAIQNNHQLLAMPVEQSVRKAPLPTEKVSANNQSYKIEDKQHLEDAIAQMNQKLDPFGTALRFGVDNHSNTFYVSVIETKTNQLIRRFPLEEMPPMMQSAVHQNGLLLDKKG